MSAVRKSGRGLIKEAQPPFTACMHGNQLGCEDTDEKSIGLCAHCREFTIRKLCRNKGHPCSICRGIDPTLSSMHAGDSKKRKGEPKKNKQSKMQKKTGALALSKDGDVAPPTAGVVVPTPTESNVEEMESTEKDSDVAPPAAGVVPTPPESSVDVELAPSSVPTSTVRDGDVFAGMRIVCLCIFMISIIISCSLFIGHREDCPL
jgi:hypothetical protein